MESSEMVRVTGIAMEFPVSDTGSFTWPPRLPTRIRRRLSRVECNSKSPCTVEEIEAKLRHADLRRQQFYENLSVKARRKPRSPSYSSSQDEDLGQRLEAKLQAAELKRSSIIAEARMRLARLDELRQAAKSGVEMRFVKEREELGTKVESRVEKAAANRMRILKAYRQRRATLKERSSQSLLRRMARESKYKERVHAAIYQKRLAAEKKRLGLLEAEKKRTSARVLLVQQVAKSVSDQREIQSRRMRDQLEERLQRAKRKRAEYLRQKRRLPKSVQVNGIRMNKQADLLSRKLARCWRRFLRLRRTTLALTQAYDALNINEKFIKSMPFEQLAILIESTATLQTVKALLDRLESRFKVATDVAASNHLFSFENIDHLLKRVASPKRKSTPRSSMRSRDAKKVGSLREGTRSLANLSRYPVRIVLCAYMILGHPDAVFNVQGDREISLAKSAEDFIREFELLIKIILEGPIQSSDEESDSTSTKRSTFRSQLAAFDKAWCSYLNSFVVWKVKDAQSLEEDLVRAACQLELSMIQTCKLTPEGESGVLTHDMKAVKKQVLEDQKLLRDKVQHLSGDDGIERMEIALSETRTKYFEGKEKASPVGSPIAQVLSPSPPSSSVGPSDISSDGKRDLTEGTERPSRVVRSLFREDDPSPPKGSGSSSISCLDGQLGSSEGNLMITENELIVNGFVHEQGHAFSGAFDEEHNSIKGKIKETMEKAFWDSIMESMKQDEPSYDSVVQLMKEVRDEICDMAPQSWKQEIIEAIDLDILSQVLKLGNPDIDYLGKVLAYALVTLQKLSSPANDDVMKASHQEFLEDLAETCQARDGSNNSHVTAMIKGLRFVLQEIQALKQEISKARIRILEPLLKGSAGLDYLRTSFANRYGSPSDSCTSLPLTVRWLSSVWNCKDQEWEEHKRMLSGLPDNGSSSLGLLPSVTLRTGGSFLVKTNGSQMDSPTYARDVTGNQQPECNGGRVDLTVRLGLLKLVSGVSGLTQESLPETFMLNLSRLRNVQAQIQKIIVISTSILLCRQFILSEQVVASLNDLETIASKCAEQLFELFGRVEDVGLEEIVNIISSVSKDNNTIDAEKLQSRKMVMARMLAKSLQAGDPIFERVSHAIYLAARGVVLGGSGPHGTKLAEMALRQIGSVGLTKTVVEACEVLIVAATVSINVHGPWYAHITNSV